MIGKWQIESFLAKIYSGGFGRQTCFSGREMNGVMPTAGLSLVEIAEVTGATISGSQRTPQAV
jgi:hypothetical protein